MTSLSVSSKRALVEQKLNPLAGRHLAFLVLSFAALDPAALGSHPVAFLEFFELLFEIHGGEIISSDATRTVRTQPPPGRVSEQTSAETTKTHSTAG